MFQCKPAFQPEFVAKLVAKRRDGGAAADCGRPASKRMTKEELNKLSETERIKIALALSKSTRSPAENRTVRFQGRDDCQIAEIRHAYDERMAEMRHAYEGELHRADQATKRAERALSEEKAASLADRNADRAARAADQAAFLDVLKSFAPNKVNPAAAAATDQ